MKKQLLLLSILMLGCIESQLPQVVQVVDHQQAPQIDERTIFGQRIVATFPAKVVGISDGDTIKVLNSENQQIKVRLASIDTPEAKQAFGNVAKTATGQLCHEQQVTVHETGKDRWKRTIAFVVVDGVNVNAELIKRGLAWHYREYSKDAALQHLEDTARHNRTGLWRDAEPVAPWEWRKQSK